MMVATMRRDAMQSYSAPSDHHAWYSVETSQAFHEIKLPVEEQFMTANSGAHIALCSTSPSSTALTFASRHTGTADCAQAKKSLRYQPRSTPADDE